MALLQEVALVLNTLSTVIVSVSPMRPASVESDAAKMTLWDTDRAQYECITQ